MGFTFHLQHHSDPATGRKLDWIVNALKNIIEGQKQMTLDFSRLEADVTSIGTVVDSAVTLLQSVAQGIRDNVANQAELGKLADTIEVKATALGEAIAANQTPVEPAPPIE